VNDERTITTVEQVRIQEVADMVCFRV